MELPEHKVRDIMRIAKEPISTETPVGEDGDMSLGDMIADQNTVSPEDAVMLADMRLAVKEALDTLTPREAKVLRMRYGIGMSGDHTLDELGRQFDVSRERIRQIEGKAMRKLMHPGRTERLKALLGQR